MKKRLLKTKMVETKPIITEEQAAADLALVREFLGKGSNSPSRAIISDEQALADILTITEFLGKEPAPKPQVASLTPVIADITDIPPASVAPAINLTTTYRVGEFASAISAPEPPVLGVDRRPRASRSIFSRKQAAVMLATAAAVFIGGVTHGPSNSDSDELALANISSRDAASDTFDRVYADIDLDSLPRGYDPNFGFAEIELYSEEDEVMPSSGEPTAPRLVRVNTDRFAVLKPGEVIPDNCEETLAYQRRDREARAILLSQKINPDDLSCRVSGTASELLANRAIDPSYFASGRGMIVRSGNGFRAVAATYASASTNLSSMLFNMDSDSEVIDVLTDSRGHDVPIRRNCQNQKKNVPPPAPTPIPSHTPTSTFTEVPTDTATPTPTATSTATETKTNTPTNTPVTPTQTPVVIREEVPVPYGIPQPFEVRVPQPFGVPVEVTRQVPVPFVQNQPFPVLVPVEIPGQPTVIRIPVPGTPIIVPGTPIVITPFPTPEIPTPIIPNTVIPTATVPGRTPEIPTPIPTNTEVPIPSATPIKTNTPEIPTAIPTNTDVPIPTATILRTSTPRIPTPIPTNTDVPIPTATLQRTSTPRIPTAIPTNTHAPIATSTVIPLPSAIRTN